MNLIHEMIMSNEIKSNDARVYETLDYYEMNLLFRPDDKQLVQETKSILADNDRVIAVFKDEIHALVERFNVAGISYVLLVGIPFSEKYHDEPRLRLQEDIDFLIAEKDQTAASGILEAIGFHKYNVNVKRKHVTFMKNVADLNNTALNQRRSIKVKLYRRITDFQFGNLTYSLFRNYVVEHNGIRVFNDEMALAHLIIHAHYYDFHPKILADIYMICKNKRISWTVLNDLLSRHGYVRPGMIVRDIVGKLGVRIEDWEPINTHYYDISFWGDLYLSSAFWGDLFVRLDKNEMTKLRCYIYNPDDYMDRFYSFMEHDMCRRVSPMRSSLFVGDEANYSITNEA